MTFSRREFFKLLGIAAASSKIASIIPTYAAPVLTANTPLLARKLGASPLMPITAHSRLSDADRMLPTDSVMPVLHVEDSFLRVPHGYIHASHVQPILRADYHPPTSLTSSSFPLASWAVVVAPSAGLYQYADTAASQVKRVGHGGILQAVDFLPPASNGAASWIALADNTGQHIGWSQAHLWRAITIPEVAPDDSRWLLINRSSKHLHAFQDNQEVFSAPCLPSYWMLNGDYTIIVKTPGVTQSGAPYALTLQSNSATSRDILITGVYWHNRFVQNDVIPSDDVHLTVHAARALYAFAPIGMRVTVI